MKCFCAFLIVIYIQIRTSNQEEPTKYAHDKTLKYISVGLVRKDWNPKLPNNIPKDGKVLDRYPGNTKEAFEIFINSDNYHTAHRERLENAGDFWTDPKYGYDEKKETIFNIQISDETNEGAALQNIVMAMAMRNMLKDYNVFSLDLENYFYTIAASVFFNAIGIKTLNRNLAKSITEFIALGIEKGKLEMENIHFSGFCWVGQLTGNVARNLKARYNKKIKSILALDPHSLGAFRLGDTLSADDAEVVHAYHTNSAFLGTMSRRSVDIIFNSGWLQPGCRVYNPFCSHSRALTALWYVILYPDKFVARKCSSWLGFKYCFCNGKETLQLTFPPSSKGVGKYYLRTLAHKPYGKGEDGSVCQKVEKTKKRKKEEQPTGKTAPNSKT